MSADVVFKRQGRDSDAPMSDNDVRKLEKAFMTLFDKYPDGIRQPMIEDELQKSGSPVTLRQLIPVLNQLSQKRKILHFQVNGEILWKRNEESAEESKIFRNLIPEEKVIYQFIEREKNMGIWIRDLRKKSNLQPQKITKIIKTLMSKKLIKCQQSIAGKNKKVYMLYNLEPAKEITGGAWYKGHEMDMEFIRVMSQACKASVKRLGPCTANEVFEHIKRSGISTVPFTVDDVGCILNAAWLDCTLEKCSPKSLKSNVDNAQHHAHGGSSMAGMNSISRYDDDDGYLDDDEDEEDVYKLARSSVSPLAEIPCTTCPVSHKCGADMPVNPSECLYLKEWLDMF